MQAKAVFINTGRGRQVVEDDLIKALIDEPLRMAVLDVTIDEPPKKDSKFYTLENVVITPHMAGSLGNELVRLAHYMLDDFKAFTSNRPTKHKVSLEMLKIMA